jgi:hypothetical protein
MKESVAYKQAKAFYDKFNIYSATERRASGFWLSIDQLRQLADDLEKQGSAGAGFVVGCKKEEKVKNLGKIFLVEILPFMTKGNTKFDYYGHTIFNDGIRLLDENQIEIHSVEDEKSNHKEPIKGFINTNIKVVHNDENSSEPQRFPPPNPE